MRFLDYLQHRAVQLKCKNKMLSARCSLLVWCSLLITEADTRVVTHVKKQFCGNVVLNLFGEESA